ncbi:hypothetical protein [Streptomyces virginiae]|uniref:hypothetical protein n=1 Tax=Streptomyces virginiae TaxID=1961 RepID=UPI00131DA4EF|nr:hypothetical protein [Streptomyces virginiae]
MRERTRRKDRTEVTFILPAEIPPGPVSVVCDFTCATILNAFNLNAFNSIMG